jgi:hypothetical protein
MYAHACVVKPNASSHSWEKQSHGQETHVYVCLGLGAILLPSTAALASNEVVAANQIDYWPLWRGAKARPLYDSLALWRITTMGKKAFFLVYLLLLLSLVLTSVTAAAESGLVGWWKLDEGSGTIARDSSGLGNDGTISAGATWIVGIMGGALQLGNSSWVAINGVVNDITSTDITLSAWIKTTQANEGEVFAANDTGSGHPLMFGVTGGTVFVYDGSTRPFGSPINNNTWHMITYVRSGTTGTIYVDGAQIATYTAGYSFSTVARWSIGQEWDSNPSDFYVGAVDDARMYNRALAPAEILTVMKGGETSVASAPSPADKATDVPRDAVLGWTAGEFAKTHDVYFGTVFTDVNTASRTSAKGVLASQGQTATTFDPAGLFAYGQTYYWRVDEVNAPPSSTVFKGEAWSFTAEPYAYPIKNITATASSAQPGAGPERTVDGSGLNSADQHSVDLKDMWLSMGTQPNWIQFAFDKAYQLKEMWVWNSNQMIEAIVGFGVKSVKLEYSLDGTNWTELKGVPDFAQAPGLPTYAPNTTVNLGGVFAKYVKLTINSQWGGVLQCGLSEVRFFSVPVQARSPEPAAAATGVAIDATLNWRPGREAVSHKVYFGTDQAAVAGGTAPAKTVTDHSFTPGSLNLGATYYWRVDEVNAVTYPGDVWSFTTEAYRVVEDFESYTDKAGAEIFSTWIDGYADNYKSSGSTVGLDTAQNGTFGETTIIHGGKQSMPLRYDNTKAPNYSEAVRTFGSPQNWTASGIKSLSLWFQGVAGNSGQLYVKINGTKVAYDGDAADLARTAWRVWNIDLSKAGNVSSVRSLTIGVEGAGAQGTLYLDDIRLYPKVPEYITPVQPAATNLVAYYMFDEGSGTTVKDSSGKGNNGTLGPEGTPKWVAGKFGGALELDGNDDYVNIDALAKSMPADNNFTVSAWIKTTITDVTRLVVASNDSAGGHDFELGLASNGNLLVQANTTGNYPPKITDGQWHMITYVRDGTTAYLYVDGVQVGTETPSGNPATQTRWSIGQEWDPPSPSDEYQGTVDDVRIYARPLSAAEVAGLAGLTKAMHKPF